MKAKEFDTIIIGGGTSAHYALEALYESQNVALIATEPIGGVCALRGCQPKKYLVAHQEARNGIKNLLNQGFTSMPESSWEQLQALKNQFTSAVPQRTRQNFQSKASFFEGVAKFCTNNSIAVNGHTLKAKNIVLATGSIPRRNPIKGSQYLKTSDDFLEMPSLPKEIAFIGAGIIAFEFAYVAASLGSHVTIIHRSNQPLKGFDSSMVERFLKATKEEGIELILNASVDEVKKEGNSYILTNKFGLHVRVDSVFETIGRMPNLSALEDEKSKVSVNEKGVIVNEFMQSVSNPRVYAIGDCTATPYQLATVADEQGKIAGQNILKGNHLSWDDSIVANAMFTHPPLCAVGLSEDEAKSKGLDFTIKEGETKGWPSSKRIGEKHGYYKMIIAKNGTLLGATIFRHGSPDLINLCTMLIKTQMSIETFKNTPLAYPSNTSDLKNML